MIKKLKEKLKYNIDHRREVVRLEKQLLGKNSILTRIHDLDKFVMMVLLFPDEWVSKIHRIYSWHHVKNKIGWFRLSEAILDWESARFTKPDKLLNARETCTKYYPNLQKEVFSFCDKHGI